MKSSIAVNGLLLAAVACARNTTGPLYKNPDAPVDDRVADLLQRMTIEEKTAQLIQGDIRDYLDIEDGTYNETGMAWIAETRANSIWTGLYMNRSMVARGARLGQDYLVNETRLGPSSQIGVDLRHANFPTRDSGLYPERRYSRRASTQRDHLQLAHRPWVRVQPGIGRKDGQGHCH